MSQISSLILDENQDDIVYFKLKDKDGKERSVKGNKSELRNVSVVFTTMFNETWAQSTVPVSDDLVTFDQYATFRRFMELIYGLYKFEDLTISNICDVYFYAHKYQTKDLMYFLTCHLKAKLSRDKNPHQRLQLPLLVECIKMAKTYSLKDVLEKLHTVQIDINKDNCLEFLNVCKDSNMENLKRQIAMFMANTDFDTKWPVELIVRIANLNRKEIADLKSEVANLSRPQSSRPCRHCGRTN